MADLLPTKYEKCQGAMLATAIGDALGWPNERKLNKTQNINLPSEEFPTWTRINRFPYWHQEQILPGEYSDDTQLTLAVARSILTENWEQNFTRYELPFWLSYERGGGKAIKKAAQACKDKKALWKQSNSQEYFNAGGNGVAMRILPHVISRNQDPDMCKLMTEVLQDGIITHGHPRALLGAACFAYALNYLLNIEDILKYGELVSAVIDAHTVWGALPSCNELKDWYETAKKHSGYDYNEVWTKTAEQMIEKLQYIKQSLEKGIITDDTRILSELECFSNIKGAGDVAVLAAIYLLSKYANNPVLGITVPAHSNGMDTDTIASMTGALLGMLCGINWIPNEWRMVQDYSCLVKITEFLLAQQKLASTKMYIKSILQNDPNWKRSPMGMVRVIDSRSIQSKHGEVIIRKFETSFGQTIYIKEYHRKQQISNNNANPTVIETMQTLNTERPQKFIIDNDAIKDLKSIQALSKKTFSKMLQIIEALLLQETPEKISKKYNIDLDSINIIKRYIV